MGISMTKCFRLRQRSTWHRSKSTEKRPNRAQTWWVSEPFSHSSNIFAEIHSLQSSNRSMVLWIERQITGDDRGLFSRPILFQSNLQSDSKFAAGLDCTRILSCSEAHPAECNLLSQGVDVQEWTPPSPRAPWIVRWVRDTTSSSGSRGHWSWVWPSTGLLGGGGSFAPVCQTCRERTWVAGERSVGAQKKRSFKKHGRGCRRYDQMERERICYKWTFRNANRIRSERRD